MDTDFARIAMHASQFVTNLEFNSDGSLIVTAVNPTNHYYEQRPVKLVETLFCFLISSLDFELTRAGIVDRRTQERLGELLLNLRTILE
jgi:hypothetical protein